MHQRSSNCRELQSVSGSEKTETLRPEQTQSLKSKLTTRVKVFDPYFSCLPF